MVPQHRNDWDRQAATCIGHDFRLVHLSVLGEIAGEQDEVRALGHLGERLRSVGPRGGRGMDVACSCDPDRHLTIVPGLAASCLG